MIILFIFSLVYSASFNATITGTSCPNSNGLTDTLSNLPACIADAILSAIANGLVYTSQKFLSAAMIFLTASPDIKWFCTPYTAVMSILESLYSITIMGAGLYYIINATEVEGRAKAKQWLKNLFFMVIMLAFSFYLFDTLLSLNQYISTTLYNTANPNLFNIGNISESVVFVLVMVSGFSIMSGVTVSTLTARYLLIPFALLLFPIAIFLYFIPFARDWGLMILRTIILIVFMTSVDALVISGLSFLFSSPDPTLAGGMLKTGALMIGFGLVGIVNSALFLMIIISAVSFAASVIKPVLSAGWKIALLASLL
jgi:hypothetical protein